MENRETHELNEKDEKRQDKRTRANPQILLHIPSKQASFTIPNPVQSF